MQVAVREALARLSPELDFALGPTSSGGAALSGPRPVTAVTGAAIPIVPDRKRAKGVAGVAGGSSSSSSSSARPRSEGASSSCASPRGSGCRSTGLTNAQARSPRRSRRRPPRIRALPPTRGPPPEAIDASPVAAVILDAAIEAEAADAEADEDEDDGGDDDDDVVTESPPSVASAAARGTHAVVPARHVGAPAHKGDSKKEEEKETEEALESGAALRTTGRSQ